MPPVSGFTSWLTGIYSDSSHLVWVGEAPTSAELTQLIQVIAWRVGRFLERLYRYIARLAISGKCLSLTGQCKVRYKMKTPYRDGTTHIIFEPLDFIAEPVVPVSKPKVNFTRFHGVFAPII